jgi:hypothetical protein
MPTIQVEANVSSSELLKAAEQLNPGEFDSFVMAILTLRGRRAAPLVGPGESELLRSINEGLPADLQQRFEELKAKRQAETLTGEEHAELLRLTEEVERRQVARLQALSDLARLRQTVLPKLMQDLGIQAPNNE